jgi:hypothetical protein
MPDTDVCLDLSSLSRRISSELEPADEPCAAHYTRDLSRSLAKETVMHPHLLEQLARQRTAELHTAGVRPARPRTHSGPSAQPGSARSLRTSTGWALVAIGLRIAESGGR